MSLVKAKITAEPGNVHLELDGEDVTDKVCALQLNLAPHDVPRLTLEFIGSDVVYEGAVLVQRYADEDPTKMILEFLDAVDPATIEASALEQVDMTTSTGAAFIKALRRQLTGEGIGDPG